MPIRIDLAGKVALVTGAGRGIGEAAARALAEAGASVVVSARSAPEVDRVAAELEMAGHAALAVTADVTDERSIAALREAAEARFGGVDILVSNAGRAISSPLGRITLDDWNSLFAVNSTGAFLGARAFAPGMVSRGWGRIIHVASIAGRTAAAYISAYAATKHAVVGFTRALAAELAGQGVTVNAVCPGYVDTRMTDESVERISAKTGMAADAARERVVAMNPQKRLIEPQEVAFLVALLCDERARGVNGQTLGIDGGAFLG